MRTHLLSGVLAALVLYSTPASAGPGSGTAAIAPADDVVAGSAGTWTVRYVAAEVFNAGEIRLAIPAAWSAPQDTSATTAGYLTALSTNDSTTLTVSISLQQITIEIDTLAAADTISVTYGDTTSSVLGRANAQTNAQSGVTFVVESDPSGSSPAPISASPTLNVVAGSITKLVFTSAPFVFASTSEAGPLVVEARDVFDNPSAVASDQRIDLSSTSSGATFSRLGGASFSPVDSVIMAADSSRVSFFYRDTEAGTPDVTASGNGQSWTVAVQQQTVTPGPVASLAMAPGDTTITAGDFVPLRFVLVDANGNPATSGDPRSFLLSSAPSGQFFLPSNHDSSIATFTIPAGAESTIVDYRNTNANDGDAHLVIALSNDGLDPSLFATADFTVEPGPLDLTVSTISADSPIVADGIATSTVTVTVTDTFGNPLDSVDVDLDATGSAAVFDPFGPTGPDGVATGTVSDTVAEAVAVTATADLQPLADSTVVDFVAGPADSTRSTIQATSPVVADDAAESVIQVTARDAHGNPVSGATVSLSVDPSGTGETLTDPGGVTDASGVAEGRLRSPVAGERVVGASINGVGLTARDTVSFVAGSVSSFVWAHDGAAVAGVNEPATLEARDALANTVAAFADTVWISTTTSGTETWALGPGAQGTLGTVGPNPFYLFSPLDSGLVDLFVNVTARETVTLFAQRGTADGTSAALTVDHAAADSLIIVSGDNQSAEVATAVAADLIVRVVDAFGNGVDGDSVTFGNVTAGGSVDVAAGAPTDSVTTSDADGFAVCEVWQLGNIVGANTVEARMAGGSQPVAVFSADGTAGAGVDIDLGQPTRNVTVGDTTVIQAVLTDQFGNVVGGEQVDILIGDQVADGTLASNPDDPNPTFTVTPTVRRGTTDVNGTLSVIYLAPLSAGAVDSVDAFSSGAPRDSVGDVTITSVASGATNLRITFVGADNAPAGQSFSFRVDAIDGNDNVDATNASVVNVAGEVGSGLEFSETDFGAPVNRVTLSAGSIVLYGRATTAGVWEIDVTDSAAVLVPDSTDVTIFDSGTIDHYDVVASVDSVDAGVIFDVTVEARDPFDNVVSGANGLVDLVAVDAADSTTLTADTLLVGSASLAGGRVVLAESYARAENIRVRARDGVVNEGFSDTIKVKPAAAYRLVELSGDSTGVVAGDGVSLDARIVDIYDNPVPGDTVVFAVTGGGGSVAPPSAGSGPGGLVSVTLTTGIVAGSNRVRGSIGDGSPAGLETVEYTVETVAGAITNLQVLPDKTVLTAGESMGVEVRAFDVNGNLVVEDSTTIVELSSSTFHALYGDSVGTLTGGVYATSVRDTVSELVTLTAVEQGGGPSGVSGVITVNPDSAYQVVGLSGSTAGLTVGATQDLVVEVRDVFANVVPNEIVFYRIFSDPGGAFLRDAFADSTDGIVRTDGAGRGLVTLHTSLIAGDNIVKARILDGTPDSLRTETFTVGTVAGAIDHYSVVPAATTAAAGDTLGFTVTALDVQDNIVDDSITFVDLAFNPATGGVFAQTPVQLQNGSFSSTLTDTVTEMIRIQATTQGGGATGLSVPVTIDPNVPAGPIPALAVPDTITANGLSLSQVTCGPIRDRYGNIVSQGTLIRVSTAVGSIDSPDEDPATPATIERATDEFGVMTFRVRSGTSPGSAVVTMTGVTGPAADSVSVEFAPVPDFACPAGPLPATVIPGDSVDFRVAVQNTSATGVVLSTATTFEFNDGTSFFSASLDAPKWIAPLTIDTLSFARAQVPPAMTAGKYQPFVDIAGTDQFGESFSQTCLLPGGSLRVSIIEIVEITAPILVSRGLTENVTVHVRNDGTDPVLIDTINLTFSLGSYTYDPLRSPPDTIAGLATGLLVVPVTIQGGSALGTASIDASVSGTANGSLVSDNSLAPNPLPQWTIQRGADIHYVQGTLRESVVSQGQLQGLSAAFENRGEGTVTLDTLTTTISFTDGTNTYLSTLVQTEALAGNATTTIAFKPDTVPAGFTPGGWDVEVHLEGLENGAPFTDDISTSGVGDLITIVTPASVAYQAGSRVPPAVNKSSTAIFEVTAVNAGGAGVVLDPDSTRFFFAGGLYDAPLDEDLASTIAGSGTTVLRFRSQLVGPAIVTGSYAPTVRLFGTENGLPFAANLSVTDSVLVQDPAAVAIVSTVPSQPRITADQTSPIELVMTVTNSGQSAVRLDSTRVRFILAGVDLSNQFDVTAPAVFEFGGGTLLPGGGTDSLRFDIADDTLNAMSTGAFTVEGDVWLTDQVGGDGVHAGTDLGGKGSLTVQSAGRFDILSVEPTKDPVTVGRSTPFQVRMAVRNAGESELGVLFDTDSTRIDFAPGAGWAWSLQPALAGGDTTLAGGETDTVVFDISTVGDTNGSIRIDGGIRGVETNSGRIDPDDTADGGWGTILAQSQADLEITAALASRPSVTQQSQADWTILVRLRNNGESDIDLGLPGQVSVAFQSETIPSSYQIPAALASGGTVLAGGAVDSLSIVVDSTGAVVSPGPGQFDVSIGGVETNSGEPVSDVQAGFVTLQLAPDADYVVASLDPDTVSTGTVVSFTLDVDNPVADGSTIRLDRAQTRLRFGSGLFDAPLDAASADTIAGGQSTTLRFSGTSIDPLNPLGDQIVRLDLAGEENGNAFNRQLNLPAGQLFVQEAPQLSITSILPSQPTVTAGQGRQWTITMVVQNNGEAAVDLNLADSVTAIRFVSVTTGDVSGEYSVQQPTGLAVAGGTLLPAGEDSLEFVVQSTGSTTGPVLLGGIVGGVDQNSQLPVADDTFDGGTGGVTVQTPAVAEIIGITTSQPTVTAGQTQPWTVTMAVRNSGGSAIDVDAPAAALDFAPPGAWAYTPPAQLTGGGARLDPGETDSLVFQISSTAAAGTYVIGGSLSATEWNSGRALSDTTDVASEGGIVVEAAAVVLLAVAPSRNNVTAGSAVPWDVVVDVTNTGGSAARVDFGSPQTRMYFPQAINPFGIDAPLAFDEGGDVVPGGETRHITFRVTATDTVSPIGPTPIEAVVRYEELNSSRIDSANGTGSVRVEWTPDIDYVLATLDPDTVSSGALTTFRLDMRSVSPDAATLRLDAAQTRLRFGAGLFNTPLAPSSVDTIAGGETASLQFSAGLIDPGIPIGPQTAAVDLVGSQNDNPFIVTVPLAAGEPVVQDAPRLSIVGILTSQATVTESQTSPWTVTVVLENNGEAGVNLDLSPASTDIQFVAPGTGDVSGEYTFLPPTGLEIAGGTRLPGGARDSLKFVVQVTGVTAGALLINGRAGGSDENSGDPVSDDTFDGGSGTVLVQTRGVLDILSISPSQPTVSANQSPPWVATMVLRNTGGSTLDLQLPGEMSFSPPDTWAFNAPPNLVGGGTRLDPGETDSLLFTVTTTAGTAQAYRIDGSADAVEMNSARAVSDTTDTSGFGSVTVQTPAVLAVTQITKSRDPVTDQQTNPWTIRVTVENSGESDVLLSALPGDVSVIFPTAAPPDTITGPSGDLTLAGGASTDLEFTVGPTPAFAAPGSQPFDVYVAGTELNDSRSLSASRSDSVLVQLPPEPDYAGGLVPTSLVQGSAVVFRVQVSQPAGRATLVLDPNATRFFLSDGTHTIEPRLDAAASADSIVGGGGPALLVFERSFVDTLFTAGPHLPGIHLEGLENGNFFSRDIVTGTDSVGLGEPTQVQILQIVISQNRVTASQAGDWTARMVVRNNGDTPLAVDSSATALMLDVFGQGDVTPEYTITSTYRFVDTGDTILPPLDTDTLIFVVDSTGATPGQLTINGIFAAHDMPTWMPISDNTFDGGAASMLVEAPASLRITDVRTSQPAVTAGQQTDWQAVVHVRNEGQADIVLDFDGTAPRVIDASGSGFAWTAPTVLSGGGDSLLVGGEIDSLVFTADVTGTRTGPDTLHAVIRGVEPNGADVRWFDTRDPPASGFGTIEVQDSARVVVRGVAIDAPLAPNVNTNQVFNVIAEIANEGGAAVDDVSFTISTSGGSATPPAEADTLTAPAIAPGASVIDTFVLRADGVTGAETATIRLLRGVDANAADPSLVVLGADSSVAFVKQAPATLTIQQVTPSQATVTRQQTQPWSVDVVVANTGAPDLELTAPAATDVTFYSGVALQLDYIVSPPVLFTPPGGEWTIPGGETRTLTYTVTTTGADTGLVKIQANLSGIDASDLAVRLGEDSASVTVENVSGLFVAATRVAPATVPNNPQPNVAFVNSRWPFTMEVVVQNSGEGVDSVEVQLTSDGTSQISLVGPAFASIEPDSSATFQFAVIADSLVQGEDERPVIFSSFIAGAISVNSGLPVVPTPPVDNQEFVTVQRRADLQVAVVIGGPPEAADGWVATDQVFQLQALVTNVGVAGVDAASPAELTLGLPAGFSLDPPTQPNPAPFVVGTSLPWTVRSPGTATAAPESIVTRISLVPGDENTAAPAAVSQVEDTVFVGVQDASFVSPGLAIASPPGAGDDTLSTGQIFIAQASVLAGVAVRNVKAELVLSGGLSVDQGDTLTKDLGDGDGSQKAVPFRIQVPTGAGPQDLYVRFMGEDVNTNGTVLDSTQARLLTVVPRAELSLNAVIASPDALDGVVAPGTSFVVKAIVENPPGGAAADTLAAPPRVAMTLPPDYAFDAASPPAVQAFTLVPGDSVSWIIRAPLAPSPASVLTVDIVGIPHDENTNAEAAVLVGRQTLAVQTGDAPVTVDNVSTDLGLDTRVVPRGATDIRMLGIELVNSSPADTVSIEWIDVTVLDGNGVPVSNPATTITNLYAEFAGQQIGGVVTQNPIRIPVRSVVGSAALIAQQEADTAVFAVSISAGAGLDRITLEIEGPGGISVKNTATDEQMVVVDEDTQGDFNGRLRSANLVILSDQFQEYSHNYPNPFRAGAEPTRIAYFLGSPERVSIRIFTISGELVYEADYEIGSPPTSPGPQEVTWDGRNMKGDVVRNGIYVCRIEAGANSATFRIAVAK